MLKYFSYLLAPFIAIILAAFIMAGCQSFYFYEFEKNNTYAHVDLPREVLPQVVDRLSGYVIGRYDNFNHQVVINNQLQWVYGKREVQHMVDVRRIFDIMIYIAFAGLVITGLAFYHAKTQPKRAHFLRRFCLVMLIGVVLLVALIGTLVMLDFSKYFVVFHEIFFDNDLWLLDPNTDVLIQMLPEVFFMDIALAIMGLSIVITGIFWLISRWYNWRSVGESDD